MPMFLYFNLFTNTKCTYFTGNHNNGNGNGNENNNENEDDNAMQHMRSSTGDAGIMKAYQVLKGVMAGWINDYNVNGKIYRVLYMCSLVCMREREKECLCSCTYVCMCVRERDSERETDRERERQRQRACS